MKLKEIHSEGFDERAFEKFPLKNLEDPVCPKANPKSFSRFPKMSAKKLGKTNSDVSSDESENELLDDNDGDDEIDLLREELLCDDDQDADEDEEYDDEEEEILADYKRESDKESDDERDGGSQPAGDAKPAEQEAKATDQQPTKSTTSEPTAGGSRKESTTTRKDSSTTRKDSGSQRPADPNTKSTSTDHNERAESLGDEGFVQSAGKSDEQLKTDKDNKRKKVHSNFVCSKKSKKSTKKPIGKQRPLSKSEQMSANELLKAKLRQAKKSGYPSHLKSFQNEETLCFGARLLVVWFIQWLPFI